MRFGAFAGWLRKESRDWQGDLSVIREAGAGPSLLLLHGLAASRDCWVKAETELSAYRRHLVQMRGFAGYAPSSVRRSGRFLKPMADELARYLRAAAEGPTAVIGHSMGGIVALILARDHPGLVSRLMVVDVPSFFSVLINPFATSPLIAGFAEAARRRFLSRKAHELASELRASASQLVTSAHDLEKVVQWGVLSDQATVADVMAEVMTTDLRPDLRFIRCPVEVVYAWDRATGLSASALDQTYQSAYANLSSVRLVRVDATRHYIMLDQPRDFYAEVRTWLRVQPEARLGGATGTR